MKRKHGGKRPGAGRKSGSGRYGEATKVMRVPKSSVHEVKKMLLNLPRKIQPEPERTKAEALFRPDLRASPNRKTLYANRVAAGMPSPAEDYTEGLLDLNEHLMRNLETTFFVRVSGDSMIEAGIHPGDLLIVDRSLRPANGKVVIAVINGELTVKRLFKEKNKLYLTPENPNYPAIEIKEEMDFMIWGVVTNVIHEL